MSNDKKEDLVIRNYNEVISSIFKNNPLPPTDYGTNFISDALTTWRIARKTEIDKKKLEHSITQLEILKVNKQAGDVIARAQADHEDYLDDISHRAEMRRIIRERGEAENEEIRSRIRNNDIATESQAKVNESIVTLNNAKTANENAKTKNIEAEAILTEMDGFRRRKEMEKEYGLG